jgi:enoyl-CoA hydratase
MVAPCRERMVMVPEFETLVLERRGMVGWLLFNRPAARNAMNVEMHNELPLAWQHLDADRDVRVIVCSGVGGAFSSGVDLFDLADDERAKVFRADIEHPASVGFTARDCGVRKPVIAAVNGLCVGGAFMWVVDADIAIAASDAQFVDPHTSIGQTVGRGNVGMVAHAPFGAVMRMSLLGRHERLSAWEACRLGMVTEVVHPPHRLYGAAQALAEKIARNSPAALAASKVAMWRALQLGLDDTCLAATNEICSMWTHADQAEGTTAFAEGRSPEWRPLPERLPR